MNLNDVREEIADLRDDAERAIRDLDNLTLELTSMRDRLERVLDTLDEEPSAPTFEGPVENCGGFIDAVITAAKDAKEKP